MEESALEFSGRYIREPHGLAQAADSGADGMNDRRYWIPSHVFACETAGGAVFLDLKRDRYFGADRDTVDVLRRTVSNWPPVSGSTVFDRVEDVAAIPDMLVKQGLLSPEAPTDCAITRSAVDLSGDLVSVGEELDAFPKIQASHVTRHIHACLYAGAALKLKSLYSVVCDVSSRKHAGLRRASPFSTERAVELVSIFRRLRPFFFTAHDRCLFHALALVQFLAYYDLFPTWVIGVQVNPWQAHSWVQHDHLLLDTNPEKVCEYTPILSV